MDIFTMLGIAIICSVVGFILAKEKGKSQGLWAFLGFMFPPALLILAVMKKPESK